MSWMKADVGCLEAQTLRLARQSNQLGTSFVSRYFYLIARLCYRRIPKYFTANSCLELNRRSNCGNDNNNEEKFDISPSPMSKCLAVLPSL